MKIIKLNNGAEIPTLGLGTYKIIDTKEMDNAVFTALEYGYRHFDTAEMYGNEYQLGQALKKYGIPRHEVFITTKIWDSSIGYDYTIKAFESSLQRLQTDYIDLYLIHWPRGLSFAETWKAMIDLYEQGRIRAIGVSNFYESHLKFLEKKFEMIPAVNQIELHPYFFMKQTVEMMKKQGITIESWSPIAKGRVAYDERLKKIAAKYGKNAVQLVIRWHLQKGFVVIPKSSDSKRIKENFDVWNFEISQEDMFIIDNLENQSRLGPDPDTFLV